MNKKDALFYGWIIVIAGFLINMTWGIEYVYGIFFKPMMYEFGWSRTVTSFAYSIFTMVVAVSGVFMGKMTDKYGPKLTIECGALLYGLGMVLCYWIGSLWHLYLLFGFVVGFGISPFYISTASTVTRWFREKRGLALGIAASGIGPSSLIFPPVAEYVISIYGWRAAFAFFGVIIWIITVPTGLFMKHNPRDIGLEAYCMRGETTSNIESTGYTLARALRTSQFWMIYLLNFCGFTVQSLILVHFVPLLTDVGFSTAAAASALGLIGVSSLIGRVGMGGISDRIGRRRALIIVFATQATTLICLMGIRNTWMIYGFAAFFGFSYGGQVPQIPAILEECFGTRSLSTIFSLTLTTFGVGGMVGPIIGGYIFDVSGSYYLALLISVVLCVLSVMLSFLLRSRIVEKP